MAEQENRMGFIEYLVSKRVTNFSYLKKFFEERGVPWLNCIVMPDAELDTICKPAAPGDKIAKRTEQLFYLGMSVGPLLPLLNGDPFVRAMAQLIEEFDYICGNVVERNVKSARAKQGLGNMLDDTDEGAPVKGKIVKVGKTVVFNYLLVDFNIPCQLDMKQVLLSFCDVMIQAYQKFLDQSSASPVLFDPIQRIDNRIFTHILSPLTAELNKLSMQSAKRELSSLDDMFDSGEVEEEEEKEGDDESRDSSVSGRASSQASAAPAGPR
eukprot:tig00001086_g6837.t1